MVYLGIPDFDTNLVCSFALNDLKTDVQSTHTGRIGKQLLNAILFLNKKGPQKAGTFCGKVCVGNWELLMMV
jgi:hypothetical protein